VGGPGARCERHAPLDRLFAAAWTVWKLSPGAGEAALSWPVIVTSLFGPAPWSP